MTRTHDIHAWILAEAREEAEASDRVQAAYNRIACQRIAHLEKRLEEKEKKSGVEQLEELSKMFGGRGW